MRTQRTSWANSHSARLFVLYIVSLPILRATRYGRWPPPISIACRHLIVKSAQFPDGSVPRKVFSLVCFRVLFQTILLSSQSNAHSAHTMRFTTWPTLANTFIISTVALLSLIPAASAASPSADLYFTEPLEGKIYPIGTNTVSWYVQETRAGSQDGPLTAGILGALHTK